MKRIFVPSSGPGSWRELLADPGLHWQPGKSAWSLAHRWEEAKGFPEEVKRIFTDSGIPRFIDVDLLLAIPEYRVDLPGGGMASHNDLFVLAKDSEDDLVSITVEGKVAEPFGPTLEEWLKDASQGKKKRLEFIKEKLALDLDIPEKIRYQLLHRMVSAVIEAERFNAKSAVMLVHSFSKEDRGFEDYKEFLGLYGVEAVVDKLQFLKQVNGIRIYSGWGKI